MKRLLLIICLTIAALTYVTRVSFASDLPACPSSGYFHNCFGSFSHEGRQYVGEWKDNLYNGQGTFTWENSDKYVGEYKDGKFNGQGTYTFGPNSEWAGEKYVGQWWNNKKNGRGTYTYANGDKYVGEFRDDKFNGHGTFTFGTDSDWAGDKYVGEFKDNKRNGRGTYTYANGNKYVGVFKDGEYNGQGTFTFGPNSEWAGDKYVGEHKDGKYNGQGTYFWANGDKYTGEFKNNASNGTGVYVYADGSRLEGLWEDWKFQGTGDLLPKKPSSETRAEDTDIVSASSGSGFAVSSDGYVITNHHVIDGCEKVVVHTKGKELPVTLVTYDPQNDLALLKGDFRPKTVFALSDSRPELLQDIYVAGFPFGDKFSTSVKVTKGIISSLTGLGNNFSNIQIDAALQSGNSGGPILDDFGNVVGVAVSKLDAKYMFEEFGIIPENTNFGIKSNVVRSVLESNSVDYPSANKRSISKSQLGEMISDGTYYISCWMTLAQIEKMKTKKVMFEAFD